MSMFDLDNASENIGVRMLRLAGIDRAMAYTVSARVIGYACSFITIPLILEFLTKKEQGFYYTFGSILGISAFFDLGLNNVILLFASHEKSKVEWQADGSLKGDEHSIRRLAGLVRMGLKWFIPASILFAAAAIIGGLYFFGHRQDSDGVWYKIPWIVAVAVTFAGVAASPVFSVFEGCGRVKEMRFISLIQPVFTYPVMWGVLLLGGGLLAGPAFFGSGFIVLVIWFCLTQKNFIKQIVISRRAETTVQWREIWPLQWRTIIGFMSGYLIYQLLNPMIFSIRGAVEAGKLGICLSLSLQISAVAIAWVGNKIPTMGELWAQKKYAELNHLFVSSLTRMIIVSIAGCAALYALVIVLCWTGGRYSERFLDPLPLALLLMAVPFHCIIMAESFFLRANKRDPLVWISLVSGFAMIGTNWLLGNKFGVTGMMAGYLGVMVLYCAACTIVLLRSSAKWQATTEEK